MKTMTCKQLGGTCGYKIIANTPEEIIKNGMKHVEENHPEVTRKMEDISYEESRNWKHLFTKVWQSANPG